jgi:hypothetical protein
MPFVNVVLAIVMATQPVTITGPITGTPTFLNWTPVPGGYAEDHPLPLPTLDITTWLGIAWYWIKTQWLDNQFFGYWLLYQFAVAVFGNAIGQILQKGGFGRLMERNLASASTPAALIESGQVEQTPTQTAIEAPVAKAPAVAEAPPVAEATNTKEAT